MLDKVFAAVQAVVREGGWTERTPALLREVWDRAQELDADDRHSLVSVLTSTLVGVAQERIIAEALERRRAELPPPLPPGDLGPPTLTRPCPVCHARAGEICDGLRLAVYNAQISPRPGVRWCGFFGFHQERWLPGDEARSEPAGPPAN